MMKEVSAMGIPAEDLQGFANRMAKILDAPDPDCICNLVDLYHTAKDRLARPWIGVTDANFERIYLGDEVSLFGMEGEVTFEAGAYGIGFCECIDWDLVAGKIKECTGVDNRPDFCFNDNFISFWELLWNFNCDDECCEVVEKRTK